MTDHERLELLYKIFNARAIYYESDDVGFACAYRSCATMASYALEGNDECLAQFDYFDYDEADYDEPDDIDSDMGFDPYMGCFTDDC